MNDSFSSSLFAFFDAPFRGDPAQHLAVVSRCLCFLLPGWIKPFWTWLQRELGRPQKTIISHLASLADCAKCNSIELLRQLALQRQPSDSQRGRKTPSVL